MSSGNYQFIVEHRFDNDRRSIGDITINNRFDMLLNNKVPVLRDFTNVTLKNFLVDNDFANRPSPIFLWPKSQHSCRETLISSINSYSRYFSNTAWSSSVAYCHIIIVSQNGELVTNEELKLMSEFLNCFKDVSTGIIDNYPGKEGRSLLCISFNIQGIDLYTISLLLFCLRFENIMGEFLTKYKEAIKVSYVSVALAFSALADVFFSQNGFDDYSNPAFFLWAFTKSKTIPECLFYNPYRDSISGPVNIAVNFTLNNWELLYNNGIKHKVSVKELNKFSYNANGYYTSTYGAIIRYFYLLEEKFSPNIKDKGKE